LPAHSNANTTNAVTIPMTVEGTPAAAINAEVPGEGWVALEVIERCCPGQAFGQPHRDHRGPLVRVDFA
jgi:hypothetical protein